MELVNEGTLSSEKEVVRKLMDDARQWGIESLRTDAQFLYTPPQIALGCIFHFNGDLVRDFLSVKFPVGQGDVKRDDTAEKLVSIVVDCDSLITERLELVEMRSKDETVKLVTGIDKKLWQCRKVLDSLEASSDTAKRKSLSPDTREVKKSKIE
jgi:cyclin H